MTPSGGGSKLSGNSDGGGWLCHGSWRVGIFLDDAASDSQAEHLTGVLAGQQGGPPTMLAPLIGELLGVERASISYRDSGGDHSVRIAGAGEIEVADFVAIPDRGPVRLENVAHPSNTTLTVAPARKAAMSSFGIEWGRAGQSGFSAPFSWLG